MQMVLFILISAAIVILAALLISGYFKRRANESNQTQPNVETTQHGDQPLNQIVIHTSPYNYSISQDWSFPVTAHKAEKILASEGDKLYFNSDCTIQTNHSFLHNSKPGYFEFEVLKVEEPYSLLFGLAPFTDDISSVKETRVILNCSQLQVELHGQPIEWIQVPTINTGDIIGILYSPSPKNQVTFTLNGQQFASLKFPGGTYGIFPTIFASKGSFIRYNFGRTPFKYSSANSNRYNLVNPNTDIEAPPSYF